MKTTDRGYSEDSGDFARLCRFIVVARREAWQCCTWSLGRVVDWKYEGWGGKADIPSFCDRNAHLWFNAFGDLVGLVIAERGDAAIAVLTAPGYRFLFADLLDWALVAWAARGPRFAVELTAHQDVEARALERRGFRRGGASMIRRFDLSLPAAGRFALEPGFVVVDMRTNPDYRARRALRANAFEGREELTDEDLRHLVRLDTYALASPIYHPETDLCVRAPDGRLVAGCEALIDAANAEADLERICTHSAFRGRGFARAVIQACMDRLRGMGIRRAYIAGYSEPAVELYASLGPAEELRCWSYERIL